ncbi:MAG TPA: hypothetical protein VHR55_03275 [Candidatus Limnocylindria bacterium]|nr:hypothetical protein [Candidatus Limnocylindria bacterium]
MLDDVVIDTCVLAHANSASHGGLQLQTRAREFLLKLATSATSMSVDPGVSWPASNSSSKIWCEYRDTGAFGYGTTARDFVTAMLRTRRVREVAPATLSQVHRYTGQGLDPRFVRVAAACVDKRLVTHDRGYNGGELRRRFGVTVCDSYEGFTALD